MCGSFVGVVLVAISKFVGSAPATVEDEILTPEELLDPETIEEDVAAATAAAEKTSTDYFVGVIFGVIAALCFSLLGVATRKS